MLPEGGSKPKKKLVEVVGKWWWKRQKAVGRSDSAFLSFGWESDKTEPRRAVNIS